MTYQQKAFACNALSPFSVTLRGIEDWYVTHRDVEIKRGAILEGGCVTGAKTPEEAIDKHWNWLVCVDYPDYVVVNATYHNRMQVRWNGFMWCSVTE